MLLQIVFMNSFLSYLLIYGSVYTSTNIRLQENVLTSRLL